jgi:hypothetical protein
MDDNWILMMSSGFSMIHKTADGQFLSAQDKRGALTISPTIVLSIC